MKIFKNISKLTVVAAIALMAGSILTSCEDYLGIKPKKQEIPETLADYVAFFNEEYMIYTPHYYAYSTAHELLGEYYNAYIAWYGQTSLDYICYYWTDYNRFESSTYNNVYRYSTRGVAVANQIIDGAGRATECTQDERQSAIASARILRVMQLFSQANYFADAYDPATAETKLSVPLLTSSEADATYTQPSIKYLYDFMIKEVEEAVACKSLPDMGATIYIPGKGAGYALLSRLKLYVRDWQGALDAANEAIKIKGDLFDWVKHYNDNYDEYLKEFKTNKMIPSPMEHDFCENYYFGFGNLSYRGSRTFLPEPAGRWFEEGDCYQQTNWQLCPYGSEYVYRAATTGYFNEGGIRTLEAYYVKAEALARLDQLADARNVYNTIRKKTIHPDYYTDVTTNDKDELIYQICKSRHASFLLSTIGFTDIKRLNAEGKYILPVIKKINGQEVTLAPDHRLWTFPFAQDVMKDESIKQNVEY